MPVGLEPAFDSESSRELTQTPLQHLRPDMKALTCQRSPKKRRRAGALQKGRS
jgi:hypothetical protein